MHIFDTATHLDALPDGGFRGSTTPEYANMVGPFGGVTAACLLQAPMQHPARQGDPIALTVNFAAPLADGEFRIDARALRTNRSTQHWAIELSQAGEVASSGTAVFALRRPTWSAPESLPPAGIAAPDTLSRTSAMDRLAWTRCYDMRYAHGGLPAAFDEQPQADSLTHVWMRDEPPRPLDFVALASLADGFFPRVMVRRRKFVPIGTVTITTYFHADAAALQAHGSQHLLGVVQGRNFYNGYFDQSAELWGSDRRLLASSHQMVYFRD